MFNRPRFLLVILVTLYALSLITPRPAHAVSHPFHVYLGFDDGPVAGPTDRVLDVLKRYGIKATFFIEGHHVAGNQDILRREIREGHHLGNHLWMHERLIVATSHPSTKILLQRYKLTEDAIHAALGDQLWAVYNQEEPIKPFRWPGGAVTAFPKSDTITYNWEVSAGDDVTGASAKRIVNNVLYGSPAGHAYYGVYAWGDNVVILLHDPTPNTAYALPGILDDLLKNGAVFDTLPRPGDAPGTMPIVLGTVPPCAKQKANCGS